MTLIAFGVVSFDDNESKAREVFDFAKAIGIQSISANPKKDEAMQKFEGSVSLADRKAAWSEVQRLFYEDAVAIKVGDFYDYFIMQNKVQGFTAVDFPPYWNIWLGS